MPYKTKEQFNTKHLSYRTRNREYVYEYLRTHPCVDCQESDIVVLELDHINPSEKKKSIARMLSGSYSMKSIKTEIEKCEVRCANCHRRRTYTQFGKFNKDGLLVEGI